jgi:hypothetical protein
MPPIPAPDAYEDANPPYGIRSPKPGAPATRLPLAFQRIGQDVSTALADFGLPPVVTSPAVVANSSSARDAHFGTPASAATRRTLQDSGAQAVRVDKGYTEQYFAGLTDGGANPAGRTTPGWYIVNGPGAPTALTLAANWTVYSAAYTAPSWYYSGDRVYLKGSRIIRTGATLAVAGGGTYVVASLAIPAALCPAELPATQITIVGINGVFTTCFMQISATGFLQFVSGGTGTIQTTGGDANHVTIPDMSWRLTP